MSDIILSIENLRKEYSAQAVPIKNLSFEIHRGEVISIIGPSGTGKSTFLRMINLLERPTAGKIIFNGENIVDSGNLSVIRQKIGMIFQTFNLFEGKTVIENAIAAPIELKGISPQKAYDKAKKLFERVGLVEKMFNYPKELSGGQKQRVAIVRALMMEPELILFDEPTSALDPTMVGEVLSVIKMLKNRGLTMLIVTHEMRFAGNVSDRIFFMNEGIIYEEGTPQEIFQSPKRDATRIFINRLKTYEKVFDDEQIDLPIIQGEIETFAHKQFMSSRRNMKLQLIFEELIYELLIKRGRDTFPVEMKILYNETLEECEVKVIYGGEKYNPFEDVDNLSVTILKGIIKAADHKFAGKNILTLKCK